MLEANAHTADRSRDHSIALETTVVGVSHSPSFFSLLLLLLLLFFGGCRDLLGVTNIRVTTTPFQSENLTQQR